MKIGSKLIQFPIHYPKLISLFLAIFTLGLASLIIKVQVDTDPENMLRADEPVRQFHDATKEEFGLHDVVVLGVVNNDHEDGIFQHRIPKNISLSFPNLPPP